jgi:AcrR family transcriptional regulator
MSNTKEQILTTALRLFAQDGYEAVSTSMIAGELGMTKSALYKHYRNKQDIFDSIMARMVEIEKELSMHHGIPTETFDVAPATYQNVSYMEDVEFTKKYFRFWTQDDFGRNFRRMLTLEQFRNPAAKRMLEMVLTTRIYEISINMYREWIHEGVVKKDDPQLLALEFCGAFHFLIILSDTTSDMKQLEELLDSYIKYSMEKTYIENGGDKIEH